MITTVLLYAAIAAQPSTVTFSHPAAHSSVVLAALGEELGLKMEPSGSVNKDYFLLRFDDVPVQEALDKIAETLNATWTEKSGVRYLGRTRAQEQAEEKVDLAGMVRGIQKYLAENPVQGEYTAALATRLIEKSLELQSDVDGPGGQQLNSLAMNSPGYRYMLRVLASFDPETLARIEEGWAVRYSANPISGLRALPSGGVRAYDQFLQETAIHRQAIEATSAISRLPQISRHSALVQPYRTRVGSHDNVVFEFRRESSALRVRMFLPGNRFMSQFGFAYIRSDEVSPTVSSELAGLAEKQEMSPVMLEAVDFALAWNGQAPGGAEKQSFEKLREALATPTTDDPLTVLGSDWIDQTARELDVNVVALLPDLTAFIPFFAYAQGAETLGALWSMTGMDGIGLETNLADGWLVVAPMHRLQTRKERLDRQAVETFIESYERTGSKSLGTVAGLVGPTEGQMGLIFSLMLAAFGLGEPSIVAGINDFGDIDALRLYSQLSPSARKAAKSGGHRIPVSSLTGDVSKFATRLLFGKPSKIGERRAEISGGSGPLQGQWVGTGAEAQEKLSDGIPSGSAIIVYVVSRQAVFPKQTVNGAAYTGGGLTAYSLAVRIASSEYMGGPAPNHSLLALVEVEQVVIEFVFPGAGFAYADAKVDHLGRDTKYMSFEDMDPAWKQEFLERLKSSREMYSEMAKEAGQRRNPPPSQ